MSRFFGSGFFSALLVLRIPNRMIDVYRHPMLNVVSGENLEILYQDDEIVAVDKPHGMLVHRSRIDVHATEFAVQKLRDQIGKPVFLIHRLDRPTSGVLLFALNSDCARALSVMFARKEVKKFYRAIVRGHTQDHGRWSEPLLEKLDAVSDTQARRDKPPQDAITQFETLRRWEIPFSAGKYPNSRYSEVSIQPLTGRKHQIRRHFNHMAHPVIGDTTHGDSRHNRLFRERLGVSRLLLVAHRLQFQHPVADRQVDVCASLGIEYEKALEQLERFSTTVKTASDVPSSE